MTKIKEDTRVHRKVVEVQEEPKQEEPKPKKAAPRGKKGTSKS
jgi:hypothetical protein